jgi:hypothetical protein
MDKKYHIFLDTKPRAFQRGEIVKLRFNIKGRNATYLDNCYLEFKMGSWEEIIEFPELRFFHQDLDIELDTGLFRTGDYEMNCTLFQHDTVLAVSVFEISIAAPVQKDRFIFWHWPSTSYYNALESGEELAKYELCKVARLGFTHAQLRADWAVEFPEEAGKLIDYALTLGIELGGLVQNYNKGPFRMEGLPDEAAIVTENTLFGKVANPHNLLVIKRNERWIESMMTVLQHYPSCSTIFMNSELEDKLTISMDADSIKYHEDKLGFSLKKIKHLNRVFSESTNEADYIQKGVISDDDPEYLYSKYYFKHGDGWVSTNRLMADIVHEYRPDINVISDPFRLCSLYGRFDGIDTVSTWTYTMPDPKAMLFNETLRCEAMPENKHIIQIITMYNYGGSLAPSKAGRKSLEDVLCSGPDRYLESAWLNTSRAPDGMGIYFSSQLEPAIENVDEYIRPPETFEAISEFSNKVLRPYGHLIRKLETSPRKVAVLDSWASRVYGECPRPHTHYQNYFIYDFYTLLNMAHIPSDVVFEETVIEEGLAGYDMLVMPCCDTLPESVYRKICEFEKNGGKVVADQWLRADIPNVIKFDFDFSYRKKVNANALVKGIQFASNEDTAYKTEWKSQKSTGITAEQDRDIMEGYCRELRSKLDLVFNREVDCDTPRVLLNRLDNGDAKYLCLVNDNRTYDDRVGQYKAILSKGVAQKAAISWKGFTGNEVLYDILKGEEIAYEISSDGEIAFEITLDAAGGTFIAAYPERLAKTEIVGGKTVKNGTRTAFEVLIPDSKGLVPVEVNITDSEGKINEYSGYFTITEGKVEISLALALDDPEGKWKMSVKNLCNKNVVEYEFNVERNNEK